MKRVSREEFEKYLKVRTTAYCSGHTTICEPTVRHYHDNTIRSEYPRGTAEYFFETEVARVVLEWISDDGDVETSKGQYWEYYVREDV
jgi:hypothetical protein